MTERPLSTRFYTIEFLRVFFLFLIILGHIKEIYFGVNSDVLAFFHTKEMITAFCVEFFLIIGGFFLYKRVAALSNPFDLVKKLYLRLMPALLFVFILCVISGGKIGGLREAYGFPLILSLTSGLTIPGEVLGWGDWYPSTYFWCSLLLIGLFYRDFRRGFLWLAILSYLTISLKFNAPYEGWMKTYYTLIGNEFIRGIYSMGVGFVAAYLSDKLVISRRLGVRLFFTVVEAYFLVLVFNYIARTSHNHMNFLEVEIVFAIFLISTVHSLGYISGFLNKISKIQMVSRYVYPIFLGHIPFIRYLIAHPNPNLSEWTGASIIIIGAIITGVFEYHVIEKRVVPWVAQYLKKNPDSTL